MSKPFIVANQKGLAALPHWLKEQCFDGYSVSGGVFNIGVGSGRSYRRTQGIVVRGEELLEPVENIIRKHLCWPERE